jgi:hypothetical protein
MQKWLLDFYIVIITKIRKPNIYRDNKVNQW